LLAGGADAFIQAAEGAEDDEDAAVAALEAHGFGPGDTLVGIAASGTTPFTLAALAHARALGGLTGAIFNNPGAAMERAAALPVAIASGAEIIAGSTRLSAGSTQKIALNTLSSAVMIRLGKTYGPYMVDMRASNAKLRRRALAMVRRITSADEASAALALSACDMHVKTAVLMLMRQLSAGDARRALAAARGSLRQTLRTIKVETRTS
jgi:N-acetylmuramic acid 6-phosphate etherase